jgi:ketosteroid isomerase-like protein
MFILTREDQYLTKATKGRIMLTEDTVFEYFKRMAQKDVDGLLNLFADDAVIYEPFSKSEGLKGRSEIEPFLRVATMANEALQHSIVIEKKQNKGSIITALVTFERGDKVKGRFTFEFNSELTESNKRKIKALHIQFI